MPFTLPKLTVAAVAVLALLGTTGLHAGSHTDEDENNEPGSEPSRGVNPEGGIDNTAQIAPNSVRTATTIPTPEVTKSVVASLNSASGFCKNIQPKAYIIDCLAERLADVNRQIGDQPGYEQVRQVLGDASSQLSKIARKSRSSSLPPAKYASKGNTPAVTSRYLIPVEEEVLDNAISQALAVIEEAETTLLRSSEGSADRAVQFQQIADAVGSNKVLLRSVG